MDEDGGSWKHGEESKKECTWWSTHGRERATDGNHGGASLKEAATKNNGTVRESAWGASVQL